ncbi:O-succinylbenzoate synthase [Salsuginibacillus halophilus]|uniref:o-succinylbenzoate synthase n=1 Tax=Salsuginibacillus halophilus TaxID=517424 RepID=A0A2P8HWA7_9BACI|nr:o-succinylbenzoate synthase [Salsuginibacillus halophilus]PSL50522.1 O-succinylbenzoate synthase [Salsuginibacillus halophilus]
MNIDTFTVRHASLKLKTPFQTVNGLVVQRDVILVEAYDASGKVGYGECAAFSEPFYTEETTATAWLMLETVLLPMLQRDPPESPEDIIVRFQGVQGHQMAKAAVEAAVRDLDAKQQNVPLARLYGGTKTSVPAGIVFSLTDDPKKQAKQFHANGYQRAKVKVQKGREKEAVNELRQMVGQDTPVMFDGNGMYTPEKDMLHLQKLDQLNLAMIEQPFRQDDFIEHARLAQTLATPVCLDESIRSAHDAYQAVQLGACSIINVKPGRVGGAKEVLQIHELSRNTKVDLWIGGMLDTGIGRAHNVMLASLPHFTLPNEIAESSRYWEEDITSAIKVEKGCVQVPKKPGIGVDVNERRLNKATLRKQSFTIGSS